MIIKDLEYLIKKIIPEKILFKKRIERSIKKNYEKELSIIEKFSNKTKDALDIGVYRGIYSYKLAQNFKFVHSFEANPLLYPYLNKNLKKIVKNIDLYNFALSDSDGETELKLPLRSVSLFKNNIEEIYKLGAASIHPNNNFDKFKNITIRKKKLDNIEIKNKIGFIKIDVEGHEIEVINGAIETIKKDKPILLIEIEKRHSKRSVDDSLSFINQLGYKSFYVKNNELISTNELKNKVFEQNYYFLPI